ncbi:MAG: hypothetical protein OXE94_02540 [Aestuariivita sp.]|nr:hypothetical protein [Aestuariivita sp.]MCY4203707.1 hypothetical protein [Aestuariivita sp.]
MKAILPQSRPRNHARQHKRASLPTQRNKRVKEAPEKVTEPTPANIASIATQKRALKQQQINLIGIFGSADKRRAILRLQYRRLQTVKVGDALAGGRIANITEEEVLYEKNGRQWALSIPTN